ncbi:uncharacterized protein V1510DRAFT_362330 [Dipodascopsis tothii]|uniref:uncharacterized protein n=1 Tax=Dipodascopsis tothii TaxID=44089 RepID=UPI0034D01174
MPFPLVLSAPFVVPLVLATVTGVAVHAHNKAPAGPPPVIRELPQTGLTTITIRPQYRTHDKVLNVYSRSGAKLYKLVQHSAEPATYSILEYSSGGSIGTVHIGGTKSEILFRYGENGGHTVVRHVVEGADSYRVFILPGGEVMQWTGKERYLERVLCETGPDGERVEIRERVAVAKRVGSRIWELKYDSARVSGEVVIASAVVSVLDQWSTVWGVGGVFFNKKNKAAVRFAS